jgi:hypothetical protein
MLTVAMDINNNDKVIVTMWLATSKDMFAIVGLICELVDFEKLGHICKVTDAKLLESHLSKQN